MSAALVACALALVGGLVLEVAPSAQASQVAPQPDAPSGKLLHFRLSHDGGPRLTPNAMNYAQHAKNPGPLLLFLPATRARPSDYRAFLRTAVASGYDVLGLDYWNRGRSVVKTCAVDPTCYTSVQRNRLDGTRPSVFSSVDPTNSIVARLRTALGYLREHDTVGDWGRYSTGNRIHWNRIVVAGHSQGGGESAYISHLHRVHGALMFSSPVETDGDISASWMAHPGATPASRLYGFVNTHDMYYPKIVGSWKALGMSDGSAPATQVPTGSHQLVSDRDIGTPRESHGRTVSDLSPRAPDGSPAYLPTWRWMLSQLN